MKKGKDSFQFDVVDREILKNLLKEGVINWYFFHEKYRLSPGQLSRSIKKLEEIGLITISNDNIKISEEARKKIIAERNKILRKSNKEYWETPEEERLGKKLELNQHYIPVKLKMRK